ncbi:MAG: ABC-ATPase domain-containing protein, partial [Myxococcota bacterium]
LEVEDVGAVRRHVESVADQRWLRGQLKARGLVAFVGDGACLPRRSGVDDRPMNDAVAFRSPPSMVVAFDTPHRGRITGMGIPRGVTLVVGGGYHGKSTLLQALERGVYDHVPGDGRELVVSASNTVKIRAEDGRRVEGVDIRAFVSDLPGGRSTADFRTDDASGSTSQAASIVEALEAGAEVLLIDEDTAATNFMIRDRRMQALVEADAEPITPFIDRVRQLAEAGVSTVLVIGGSGDYLDVADRVVAMRGYRASERTDDARAVAAAHPTGRRAERTGPWVPPAPRVVRPGSIDPSRGRRERKIAVRDFGVVEFGEQRLDLSLVGGLVATSQLRAVAFSLAYLGAHELGPGRDLTELLDRWEAALDEGGLDAIDPGRRSDVAEVRRLEVAAALNRLRSLRVGSP